MSKYVVDGQHKLNGIVRVGGAKNSALKVMAAALLGEGTFKLRDVPQIKDVLTMCGVLNAVGVGTRFEDNVMELTVPSSRQAREGLQGRVPEELAKSMRASIQVMGPLLARLGWAEVAQPGGCAIGTRTLDIHLSSLEQMGASIEVKRGVFLARAPFLRGADITFRYPSVGATENIMMAATLAKGETVIRNAAQEPEIVDIQNFLNSMGAKVQGAGSPIIKITGVTELGSADHQVMPDRIEAGTYLLAFLITGGQGRVENVIPEHLRCLIELLVEMGANVGIQERSITIQSPQKLRPIQISTGPYPSFPTDLQPQIVAVATQAQGISRLRESVFDQRFGYTNELKKLGAEIVIDGQTVSVLGPRILQGAELEVGDLRGGAALVLAALAAKGQSNIIGIEHIDRGYEGMENRLAELGARVRRIE